jgi:Mu-like prophage major head subunit gpT
MPTAEKIRSRKSSSARSSSAKTSSPMRILTRRSPLKINSFEPETGIFFATAASGMPVERADFFNGTYQEVLSMKPSAVRMGRLQSGRAPLLDAHRAGSAKDQIGVIAAARIERDELVIEGRLSQRDDLAPLASDIAAGVVSNVSVAYRSYATVESKGPDGSRIVTHTDWEPLEVSIVPIGADPQAHIRSGKDLPMSKRRIAAQIRADEIEDQVDDVIDNDDENEETEIETRNAAPAVQRRVTAAQENQLRSMVAPAFGVDAAVVDDCIARGLTMTQARDAIQSVAASRASPRINPHITIGGSASDPEAPDSIERGISGALYARMTGKAPEGRAREFMGRSMIDMGVALIESHGERVGWSSRDKLATRIMQRSNLGGLHSTSDFPNLLQGAGNRVLLESFKAAQTPLLLLARKRDAADFRALSAIKLGEAPKLEKVPEGGEVKHGTRAEAKESFRVNTFAKIFGLTRQAIVNDDLNAFADVNNAWGRAAAEAQATELVALLTANNGDGATLDDGNPLYKTTRGNKAASGTLIDVSNLGLARKALREMKGLDGVTPISVTPKHLVVGAAKETEAEQVLTTLAAAEVSNTNPFSGKLTLHVEPRLTGNAWRLFADPTELAVISIAYLNGQEGPQLETREGWEVLGTEFRCVLDFGCGVTEYRGTYLNAGN